MKFSIPFLSLLILLLPASLHAQENPFEPFGLGVDGQVRALESAPNGDLYIGGMMAVAGTKRIQNIVKYNGEDWIDIGRTTSHRNYVRHMKLAGNNFYVAFTKGGSDHWENELITPQGNTMSIASGSCYQIETADLEPGIFRAEVTLKINGSGNDVIFPVEISVDPLQKPWNPSPEGIS